MRINEKFTIIAITMIFVLVIIPLLFINLAQPHEFMGIMILLFFYSKSSFDNICKFNNRQGYR